MKEATAQYEQVIDEETKWLKRIRTCEAYLTALLEHTHRNGSQYDKLTVEDIVTTVHTLASLLRTELVLVQLEKALLSSKMRKVVSDHRQEDT
ncbi:MULTISPECIES: hypothetical protein [unclassified Paenibacillus]|uniref:hypothetical protein n=1 Tax=unclassified Paenibacillus TaxID=185978 RepID=UPI0036380F9D